MKRRDRRDGFGTVEVIIIVVAIVVLVAAGLIAYNALMKRPAIQASQADLMKAQATTQAFYAAYTDSHGQGADILQRYGTSTLIAASKSGSKSYSPIVCAQNVAPVSTSSATYKDGHFNVPVTLKFSEPLSFTVEVVKSGDSFKIDKVNCPQQTTDEH